MNWQTRVTNALKNGTCFSNGNYAVCSEPCEYSGGHYSIVLYYGHKVFTYDFNPLMTAPNNEKFSYDFCGYEGHRRTTKLINHCLETVNAKYRVKTVKGNVVEVPVTAK